MNGSTYEFPSYHNQDARTTPMPTLYDLGMVSNYALDDAEYRKGHVVLKNNSNGSFDQSEVLFFRRDLLKQVNTSLEIQAPAPVKSGISYAYQWESLVKETTAAGDLIEHPVKMYLTVIHERNEAVTDDVLNEGLRRVLSTIPFKEVDGKLYFQFSKTALGALRPLSD